MSGISTIAKEELSSKELVDFFKDEPMDFDPGEKFVYNNSGYVLLGYIIELVSGESYEAFIENNIFEKLGMSDSRYAHYREIVYNRAYGYHNRGELTNKIFINNNIPYASGALMSTVEDMLSWQNAIDNDVLLNPSSLKKAFSNYSLNNGEHINYGFGWHIVERDGIKMREHGGSIFGFKSMGVYIPEKNIYVIGFTNWTPRRMN